MKQTGIKKQSHPDSSKCCAGMAADHSELLAEMATVGRLSATERLKHAQKRRAQQLKSWAQMEKDAARGSRAKADKKKPRTKKIKFPDAITLLDAAARNDLEEGWLKHTHSQRKNIQKSLKFSVLRL